MKLYFIHIPKNGGTSVRNFFFKHFGDKCYNSYTLYNEDFLSQDAIDYIETVYNYDIYTDHRLSLKSTEKSKALTLAVVRDPVDRFISAYNFFSSLKNQNYPYKSIEDAVEKQLIQGRCLPKTNSQVYHLTESLRTDMFYALKTNYILIPMEHISCIPEIFGIDDKLTTENQSNTTKEVHKDFRELLKGLMYQDSMLHEIVLEKFNLDKIKKICQNIL